MCIRDSDIEGRVDPTLGKRLKADGDGWIVPPAAAPWDFGLIVLRNPPSGITPLPLFCLLYTSLDVFIEKAEHPFYRALGELARLTLAQWQSQLLIPVAVKPLFR